MDHELLATGQFARLCRLSMKQLRHYDELGLLRLAQVDPNTGYRYYRADQARAAVSIALLRSLDVPLAQLVRCWPVPPRRRCWRRSETGRRQTCSAAVTRWRCWTGC